MSLRRKLAIPTLLGIAAIAGYLSLGSVEHSRELDPSGRYRSIISYRPYHYIPLPIRSWGVHSDTPCFVEIEDTSGRSYGRVPLGSIQSAEVRWGKNSAAISGRVLWDFASGTCSYQDPDSDREVILKTNG
jgi:hypothetical protein